MGILKVLEIVTSLIWRTRLAHRMLEEHLKWFFSEKRSPAEASQSGLTVPRFSPLHGIGWLRRKVRDI